MAEIPPGLLADGDRAHATFRGEVEHYVTVSRRYTAETGDVIGGSRLAFLLAGRSHLELAAVAALAIQRLGEVTSQ